MDSPLSDGHRSANKAVAAVIFSYRYLYKVTIGATACIAMSDIATTRLRQKTASLALFIQGYWLSMWKFVLAHLFNPNVPCARSVARKLRTIPQYYLNTICGFEVTQ
jgi:hypothetical protein